VGLLRAAFRRQAPRPAAAGGESAARRAVLARDGLARRMAARDRGDDRAAGARRRRDYFSTDLRSFPISAGLRVTRMPHSSITASFSCAVPLPPEMIAPACPIRFPGGAVTPAMNPTTGFFMFS